MATALLTLFAAIALVWALRHGFLDNLAAQSMVVFDASDLRLTRPWENDVEQREREATHGALIDAPPAWWGGAA